MSSPFSEDLLARLSVFATAEYGLRFPPDRWHELARGVASAALELGVSDLQGWAENLAAGVLGAEDRMSVANHLTISETYFFRHPETFVALEKEILPGRIAERRKEMRPLRIWSAGCASGEEPYSVAILLRHKFAELRPDSIAISGTDLNSHVIERASQGLYSEWSFRDAPPWLKPTYFERTTRGHYRLSPAIRDMVRFSKLNFAAPLYPAEFGDRADFDVILCRNVLMYFSAEWQDKIIRRFTRALAPGGWLLVGPCDVTAAEAVELRLRGSAPGIYQKRGDGAADVVETPFAPTASFPVSSAVFPAVAQKVSAAVEVSSVPAPPADVRSTKPAEDPTEALSARALTLANRGELAEALDACDRALAADKLNPAFHHLRGCVLSEMNRLTEAEQAFRQVLYLDPDSVMAEFALASLAQRAGRAAEARHRYTVVLRLLSTHPRGEAVPQGDGVTVARLQEVVERTLNSAA